MPDTNTSNANAKNDGKVVDTKKGSWQTSIADDGKFKRRETTFRRWVRASPEPGSDDLPAEKDRYHLYVSYACPWAHRTLIVRALKGLEEVIPFTAVDHFLGEGGWRFGHAGDEDTVTGAKRIAEIYHRSNPDMTAHFTVPVLFDKKEGVIVNNESSEIIRMLTREFDAFCKTDEQRAIDLYPEQQRSEIDEVNAWIYPQLNNGVYKAGFAQSQSAYEEAEKEVFDGLARLETILGKSKFLTGDTLTEADVRLVTTLLRFDPVYHFHFKLQRHRLVEFKNVWAFTRLMYQMPAVRSTTNLEHIVKHYLCSHKSINPFGIIPVSPEIDWEKADDREF